MSHPEREASYHVGEKLRVRASAATSVRGAWRRGERLDVPAGAPLPHFDEARYDARSDVVIFRREDTLVTAYGLIPEFVTSIHGVAIAAAVDEQFGTDYRSGITAGNLEEVNR